MRGNGSKATRRYTVRDASGHWMADVFVTDDGLFSTVSDWGNYGYWWSNPGEPIRSFLCRVSRDSLLGKLGGRDEFQGDKTERAVKKRILEWRREKVLTMDEAREHWIVMSDHDLTTSEGFHAWYLDTDLDNASECAVYGPPQQLVCFMDNVWPAFVAMLHEELDAEKAAA